MRVFISWSGTRSKGVAELLKNWIKGVIQATDPFISTEDVEKGSIWFTEIGDTLASTNLGIICLTSENHSNPWILFEAGALSKGLSKSRVWTLLIDVDHTDLRPPLSQFNGTKPVREDMFKLLGSINASLGEKALPQDVLTESFENWWPKFEEKLKKILAAAPADGKKKRDLHDLATETLSVVRSIQNAMIHEGPRVLGGSRGPRVFGTVLPADATGSLDIVFEDTPPPYVALRDLLANQSVDIHGVGGRGGNFFLATTGKGFDRESTSKALLEAFPNSKFKLAHRPR